MSKSNRIYKIFMTTMIVAIAGMLLAMGIIAAQKTMRLGVQFSSNPNYKLAIAINDEENVVFQNFDTVIMDNGISSLNGDTLVADEEAFKGYGNDFTIIIKNYTEATGIKIDMESTAKIDSGADGIPAQIEAIKNTASKYDPNNQIADSVSFRIYINSVFPQETTLKMTISEYNTYTVSFSGPSVSNATAEVGSGEAYSTTLTPKEGYNIPSSVSITVGGVAIDSNSYTYTPNNGALTIYTGVVNGDVVITATATAKSYTITYTLNGGTNHASNPATYTVEDAITLQAPTRNGYNFAGWTGTDLASATTNVTFSDKTGDRSYTATWTIINYTITYNLAGGTNHASNPTTYTVEDTITLRAPTRNGYNFAGWTGTELASATTNVTFSDKTGDRSYTATWTIINYTITYTLGSNVVNHPSNPATYTVEDTITLKAPIKDGGYIFGGWTGSNGETPETSVTIPQGSTGNKTYTVSSWTLGDYTLMTGQSLNAKIKQIANNNPEVTYAKADSTVKSIIFGRYSDNSSTVGAWGGGIAVDSNSAGNIRMFLTNSNANCYILSDGNIDAHEESSESGSYNRMFYYFRGVTSFTFNNFNTSNVTDMSQMFTGCSGLTNLTLGNNFNTSKVTNMSGMFQSCSSLTSIIFPANFGSAATNMSSMFSSCSKLTSLGLSNFNTSNVTNMQSMFQSCSDLQTLTLGNNFNTKKVTTMWSMFGYCSGLTSLDLSSFNTSSVTNMGSMFSGCRSLKTIYVSTLWSTEAVTSSSNMFNNCTSLVGGKGTSYATAQVKDSSYAKIDGGTSNPGYFTSK